jgi:hypothetical protein
MIHNDWQKWSKEYEEAWAYYKDYGMTMDEALYDLCKKYPRHRKKSEIAPKIGIIGRSYASGLERHSKKSFDGITDFFFENRKAIDNIFDHLRKLNEPLTEGNLIKIVSLHGQFLEILRRLTRGKAAVRSFASKYMHFHCSAVPIFDNVVLSIIRNKKWYPLTNTEIKKFEMPSDADEEYYNFCMRFFAMYKDLKESRFKVGVKRLDHYLFWQ